MDELDADRLVGLLAEEDRRRVAAALILAAGDVTDVVAATGLQTRAVVDALDRLRSAGLVEQGSDGVYVILDGVFKAAARAAGGDRGAAPARRGDDDHDDARLIARCLVDGRLVHLPRKRSKRLVVLDALAQRFEPGVHYHEREVNSLLRRADPDVAALRRYLVDEGILDRADGTYWRSGGTVAVD